MANALLIYNLESSMHILFHDMREWKIPRRMNRLYGIKGMKSIFIIVHAIKKLIVHRLQSLTQRSVNIFVPKDCLSFRETIQN